MVDDTSNLTLAGDLIKKNISDATVIHSAASVQYRACHCHKNVCLNVNFKQESIFANNCRIGIYLAKTRFMHNPPIDIIPETPSKRGNGSGGSGGSSSSEQPVEKKEKTSSTTKKAKTTTTSTDTDTGATNNFSITLNSRSPLVTSSSDELELVNTSTTTTTTDSRSINTSTIHSVNSYKEKDKEREISTINEPPPLPPYSPYSPHSPHCSLSPQLIQQQQKQPTLSYPIPQNNNNNNQQQQQQQQQFSLPNQVNLNNQLIIQIQNYNNNNSSTVFTCPYIPQLKSHFQNCLRSQIPTPIERWKRKWDIFFFTVFNHISTTMTPANVNLNSTSGSLLILSTSNFLINEDLSAQDRVYSDIPTSEWILSRLKFLLILEEFLYPLYNCMFSVSSLSPNSAFSSLQ